MTDQERIQLLEKRTRVLMAQVSTLMQRTTHLEGRRQSYDNPTLDDAIALIGGYLGDGEEGMRGGIKVWPSFEKVVFDIYATLKVFDDEREALKRRKQSDIERYGADIS